MLVHKKTQTSHTKKWYILAHVSVTCCSNMEILTMHKTDLAVSDKIIPFTNGPFRSLLIVRKVMIEGDMSAHIP